MGLRRRARIITAFAIGTATWLALAPPGGPLPAHAADQPQLTLPLPGFPGAFPQPNSIAVRNAQEAQVNLLRGADSPGATRARENAIALGISGPGGTWMNLGPAPLPNGQTDPTSVPVSGRVTAIAIDPRDANVVYIGAAQGGVWRSTDGGATWTALMDTAASLAIGALALAPSSPSTLYVGTGEANNSADSFQGVGVYRIDNADTAATVVGPINPAFAPSGTDSFGGRSISQILVKRDDPATIFVTTGFAQIGINGGPARGGAAPPLPPKGLWRSTNATAAAGSVAFQKLNVVAVMGVENVAISDMVFDPADATSNTLLTSVYGTAAAGGIYRTTNALAATPTFTQVQAFATANIRVAFAATLSGSPAASTIFAATSETQTISMQTLQGVLRRAPNGGAAVNSFAILAAANGFCQPQCDYDIAVAVPPTDPTKIYLGGCCDSTTVAVQSIFDKSTDSGATFTRSDGTLHPDAHAIAIAGSNSAIIYTGNDGGVWKSIDSAGTWVSENTPGLSITQFMSIAVHPIDPNFTIGGTQDNGTAFLQPSGTYKRADFGDGGYSQIDQNAADNVTVTMYHTYFNKTNVLLGFARVDTVANAMDNGWVFKGCSLNNMGMPVSANGIGCADAVNFYPPLALGPGNPNTVYFGTDRLYRSINKGDNNNVVSQAPLTAGVPLSAIGISRQNDNVRILGNNNGQVFATTTGSATLTDVTPTAAAYKPQYIARAVIDPSNVNTAYITLAGYMGDATAHIWKTTNLAGGAATWTQSASGIPDVPVDAFVVDPQSPSTLYAGTDIGVYRSLDGGGTWTPFGTGLPTVAVFDMALTAPGSSQVLRISTHGRGQWQIPAVSPGANIPELPWLPLAMGIAVIAVLPLRQRLRVRVR